MPEPATPNLPITGHCLCGLVRFEVTEPLTGAHYCHCTRCQRRTGTAFSVSASAVPGSFRVTEGEKLVRAYRPSDGWAKFFCGECGGHVYSQSNADPDQIGVRMGAIDGDPGVRPSAHQFVAYAAVWEPLPDDGLPRYDERTPA